MNYTITHSTSIVNGVGNYKKYKNGIADRVKLIHFTMNYIIKHNLIDFCDNINIHVKPIKKFYGLYYHDIHDRARVELNVRNATSTMIRTILHELKHSEQYKQDRLKVIYDYKRKSWIDFWEGNEVSDRSKKYEDYRNLPWEIDARTTEKYAPQILAEYIVEISKNKELVI